jgi:hypothetical protein
MTDDTADQYTGALLPALEIVEKATKQSLSPRQREGLAGRIKGAILAYHGTQFMAETARGFTLHEIAEPTRNSRGGIKRAAPLDEMIALLEHEANIDGVLVAGGAPDMLMVSPYQEEVQRVITEYRTTVSFLRKIRDNMPEPPEKRRGRCKAHDLYRLVGCLAHVWKTFTGEDFTQLWHKEKGEWEPLSGGAQFVHAVIKVVDPKRLPSVPEVTEQIVRGLHKERLKATSDK